MSADKRAKSGAKSGAQSGPQTGRKTPGSLNQGQPGDGGDAWSNHDDWADTSAPALSRAEADKLRERLPPVLPWRGVAAQAVAGVLVALTAWAVTQRSETGWSALYGAATMVVPSMLFARGWTRGLARGARKDPGTLFLGFMFWEMVKMGFAVAMLVAAASIVPRLEWPALLVALVVCMKVNWLALAWRGRK